MKKKSVCIMVLCLAMPNLFASREIGEWEYFEGFPEEQTLHLQEEFTDAEKLERYLVDIFRRIDFLDKVPPLFKRKFNVSDETLRTALMNIVLKFTARVGWNDGRRTTETLGAVDFIASAITWLGVCADAGTKQFLMGIATDDAKLHLYRMNAIRAYLRCADAQEMRDAIVRFLSSDMKAAVDPCYTYSGAMRAYDEAEGDPLKREAIVASLSVMLAREDEKCSFVSLDKDLAQRNKEYAGSSQRLMMLKRMSARPSVPTPPGVEDLMKADDTLKTALESYKSRKTFTNVSTNLTELMARDFRKPTGKRGQ